MGGADARSAPSHGSRCTGVAATGARAIPGCERDEWIAQYFELLVHGFAVQPAFSAEEAPKQRGRRKQSVAKNLLGALLRRADQVLAFLDDLSLPLTNDLVAYCTPCA